MKLYKTYPLLLLTLLGALFLAACSSTPPEEDAHADDHTTEDGHDGHEMENRIPNENGAAVHIIAPNDGSVFQYGDQIIVEIETSNFTLEDGRHWHVYVDDESWGMVMGGNTTQPLNGVSKGAHVISVHIANEEHIEFMEGDAIQVLVE